jgi:hypothetical protein
MGPFLKVSSQLAEKMEFGTNGVKEKLQFKNKGAYSSA